MTQQTHCKPDISTRKINAEALQQFLMTALLKISETESTKHLLLGMLAMADMLSGRFDLGIDIGKTCSKDDEGNEKWNVEIKLEGEDND